MLKQVKKKDSKGNTIIYTVDKKGVKQGPYEEHWENGGVEKGTFKDGKKEGPFERVFADGGIGKGTYRKGKAEGLFEEYHKNGQLAARCYFKNGKDDGLYESYYENGQLSVRTNYKDGKEDGLYEQYDANGRLQGKVTFKMGEWHGLCEEYYENGRLKHKGVYIDGYKEGVWEYYSESGKLTEKKAFHMGRPLEGKEEEIALFMWQVQQGQIEGQRDAEAKRHEEEAKRHEEEAKGQEEKVSRAEAIGGLKGQLKMLSDPAFRKPVGPARTPERQAKAEEIVEVRRARTLLSRAANKALDEGDRKLFSEIEEVARPYALHNRRIELEFRKKRAERRLERAKKDRE